MLLNRIITKTTSLHDISSSILNIFLMQNKHLSDIQIYKDNILENEFISINAKLQLEKIYIKCKNIKNKLTSFVKIYKWKKSVLYEVDYDLYLKPLKDFPKKQIVIILENNTRYSFRLNDLNNYWIICLTNNQGLFSKPLELKNPHTNIKISTHNLFNIYFALLNSSLIIPLCINGLFSCLMNVETFSYQFYGLLKERTIVNFIKSDGIFEKYEQILNMLHDLRKDVDYLTISNTVTYRSKVFLCKKLKETLLFYLKNKYSCNPLIRRDSGEKVKMSLKTYLQEHPNYGLSESDIIKYVPFADRPRRTQPPPPPPGVQRRIPIPPPIPPPILIEPTTTTSYRNK